MCAHSPDNAMGLIINKPTPGLEFASILEQMSITPDTDQANNPGNTPIHFGGPVETQRGFVLHSTDYPARDTTLAINNSFAMTATRDILEHIAHGTGPQNAILAIGYAGWGPGQLESEIGQNGWLTCDAAPDLVFNPDNPGKWTAALNTLGVDPLTLSATAGRA
jgi:putative transcriptional regulator